MEKARKLCFVAGFLQMAAGIGFLFLPLFRFELLYYSTPSIRGWHMAAVALLGMDLMEIGNAVATTALILSVGSVVLVIICLLGAVFSWAPGVSPFFSAGSSVAGLAAETVLFVTAQGIMVKEQGIQWGVSWYVIPAFLLAAAVIGFVAAGMRASAKKKPVPVAPAVHEKLPDLSEKIENKKYYQVVEKEPAPRPAGQEGQAFPSYTPGGEPRGVMVGLAGVYAGVEIPFQEGETIRVGRDASSNLIFDKRAPRVSRHHCEITWNPGSRNYSIVDTSTNGTFKNGSENCLPQNMNIVLEVGCTISLGSDDNMFRLE